MGLIWPIAAFGSAAYIAMHKVIAHRYQEGAIVDALGDMKDDNTLQGKYNLLKDQADQYLSYIGRLQAQLQKTQSPHPPYVPMNPSVWSSTTNQGGNSGSR